MAWVESRVPHTEEGQAKWEEFLRMLNTPPVVRRADDAEALPPSAVAALPPGAPVTPEAQAAAFDALSSL